MDNRWIRIGLKSTTDPVNQLDIYRCNASVIHSRQGELKKSQHRPPHAAQMSLYTLPFRPPCPIITCRVSSSPAVTLPSPPPSILPPTATATATAAAAALPSPTCALQCPHFETCSGCTHEFNLHRPIIVEEATDFFKSLGVSDFTFDSCRLWGWRCRAKLAVRGSSENPLIGLYQEGTHNVVDIPQCKAHHPNINAAVELLRQGIRELNIEPYDEDQGTGDLRYLQMAVTTYNTSLPAAERYRNGRVQVSLVWNSRNEKSSNSDKLNALANFLWRNGGPRSNLHLIHSVWANFQTSTNNIIFGNRWRHLLGERDFWEHVGGIDISLDPSSFGQANTRAFDNLLQKLHKHVPYGASVADLYAGAGVIGLSLAANKKCRSVKCIEINKESKPSFEKTIDRLPNSIEGSISWHNTDTSIDPLSWLVGSDVIVVDPPRKGLDASLIDALRTISSHKVKPSLKSSSSNIKEEKRPWILREKERAKEASIQVGRETTSEYPQSLPQTLIYISCGWESFKKDCKALLTSKSWHLEKAHGFNFFPGTQSIEVLAVFKRSLKKKKTGKKKKKQL
ncbi:S-adenosyl-L-methionine-dependent methyltransferases superfamily protein [Theobroma cacao]|uniref:S-adenosyl-L-methionine-dependent methyltransferases superfamily protein n=1 Tax=Theobroma cacao TaxID=3641 RepID=A0A061EEF1_THECC|nr:S-adenosyl-L-methionine-dependent methyltransferases superfamily protein [Theobroma cacao]